MVQCQMKADLPEEKRSYVVFNGYCKWGTTTLFDMRVFNLDTVHYLPIVTEYKVGKVEAEKKAKYIHTCLEYMQNFNPLV